jgi:hypothetical protein
MVRTLIAALALTFALVVPGYAQLQRLLPANGKRGDLVGQQTLPLVQINNKVLRLAPGAVVYDENNRTIVHSALPERASILYVLDSRGDVQRLYILTREEQARLDQAGAR